MKLMVTGASGFLGRYVVETAIENGHNVRALLRPACTSIPERWKDNPNIEIVRADLRSSRGISNLLEGVDGVIHLAAAKSGDLYEQFSGTVIATENLLKAMESTGVRKIVLTSSFSVYEYLKLPQNAILDENSPMAVDPFERDEYCQTKLVQEKIVLEQAEKLDWHCVILRPGVIFGKDNLWTARLGMQLSERLWFRAGSSALLPLTYVENCADAAVMAISHKGADKKLTLNVVDNEIPSQRDYLKELCHRITPSPHVIPLPWWGMRLLARLAWLTNKLFFRGTAKIPGLFIPSRLHARCKPLQYTNDKIKTTLDWEPKYTWKEGLNRSLSLSEGKKT